MAYVRPRAQRARLRPGRAAKGPAVAATRPPTRHQRRRLGRSQQATQPVLLALQCGASSAPPRGGHRQHQEPPDERQRLGPLRVREDALLAGVAVRRRPSARRRRARTRTPARRPARGRSAPGAPRDARARRGRAPSGRAAGASRARTVRLAPAPTSGSATSASCAGAPGRARQSSEPPWRPNHASTCSTFESMWLGRAAMPWLASGMRTKAVSMPRSCSAW